MSKEILQDIINDFSPEKFSRFFRNKSRLFSPRQEAVGHYDDEGFKHGLKLGEIKFSETEKLIVCSFQVKQSLSERSGKKAQYEKGKNILKDAQSDAGIFIFYDQIGNFRFSLIYPETIGNRRQWSSFRRFTYFVSREFTNRTFLQQIGDSELSSIEKIKYAFNVEKVTKEFYLEYRNLFESLVKDFSSNHTFINEAAKNDINTENFAKKLLGQIVFIYFIQKKGWMGVSAGQNWGSGDKNFLVNIFKETISKKENFFNDYLEPLFYGTLNNPRRNTADPSFSKDFDCRIPFLNGGLFEAEYDWKNSFIYLDNNIFKSIFDVFERFNFTVEEESPDDKEIAVDPEMLGKVFENLLPENLRKGTGTYYTPREIVYYMCQESLVNYLDSNSELGKEKTEKCVKSLKEGDKIISGKEAIEIDNLLENMKICDPACGSGAFLVGMLSEIVRLRLSLRILYPGKLSKKSEYQLKKDTIHNCIYGVDIDPGAIEIAKLRLWLTLVVDYEIRDIEPLPNLDYRLMCGNSLLEEFEGVRFYNGDDEKQDLSLFKDTKKQEKIAELKKKVEEYFDIHDDEEKRSKRKEINDIKDWLIKTALEKRRKELASHRKSEEAKLNMFDEKNRKKYFENWGTKFLAEAKINEVLENLHNPKKAKPFFIWKLEFIDVFEDKGGFDIVIANPPYIDSESMVKSGQENIREAIQKSYSFTKGNWDIYIAFLELAYNKINNDGVLSFITPDKWISKPFGDAIRKNTINNIFTIVKAGREIFEGSKVDSIISFFSRKCSGRIRIMDFKDRLFIFKRDINKKMLREPFALDWLFSDYLDLLIKIDLFSQKISLLGCCENACATSDAYKIESLIENLRYEFDPQKQFKIINTGTIGKYYSKWGIQEMTYLGRKYLKPIVSKDKFFRRFKNSYAQKPTQPKIILKGLNLLDACLDADGTIIPGKSTLIIISKDMKDLKFLLALINSKLVYFYLKEKYISSSYNLGISFTKEMINNFPIPDFKDSDQESLVKIIDKILIIANSENFLNSSAKQSKVKEYECQIDQMVYKLYGLTKEEIQSIENNFS